MIGADVLPMLVRKAHVLECFLYESIQFVVAIRLTTRQFFPIALSSLTQIPFQL